MKLKIILILLPIWLSVTSITQATHLDGGSISFSLVSGSEYKIVLTLYTDSASVIGFGVDEPDAIINFGDGTSQTVARDAPGKIYIGNGTFENRYTCFQTFNNGTFVISYARENRSSGILNIDNSGNTPFYIETKLVHSPTISNNSGIHFYAPPVLICEADKLFRFNITAYDDDHDSLIYKLITPQQASGVNVSGYGNPGTKPMAGHLFLVDLFTGAVKWDKPVFEGRYAIAILVEEYRNQVLIGSVIRDYTINVVPSSTAQEITTITQANFNTQNQLKLEESENVEMKIVFFDNNATIENFECFSELLDNNNATFNISDTVNNGKKGIFSFTATSAMYRNHPYVVVFRTISKKAGALYATDITYSFYIGSEINLGIKNLQSRFFSIYPNPSSDYIFINSDEGTSFDIELVDMDGKKVNHKTSANSNSGIDISKLSYGIYQVILKNEREVIYTEKFIKR